VNTAIGSKLGDEEIAGRRFQTPLAAAHQDGRRREGEDGKTTQPVVADVSGLQTERAESPKENSRGQAP
jgi:hypothetical protein